MAGRKGRDWAKIMVRKLLIAEGIKKAISVGVKNNTNGLGAKKDEWAFQWWDHVFNKATSNIVVSEDCDGEVKLVTEVVQVKKEEKKLLYGAFVKAGDVAAIAEVDEKKDYSVRISDKDLFEACEGRTARKGARGEQDGKLARTRMSDLASNVQRRKERKELKRIRKELKTKDV